MPDETVPIIEDVEEISRRLTRRHGFEEGDLPPHVQASVERTWGEPLSARDVVERIISEVRAGGDAALASLSQRIEGHVPDSLEVPADALRAAFEGLDADLRAALRLSAEQIERFHAKQRRTSWVDWDAEGALGQIVTPLDRVGIYAPGGTAPYPSTLLMVAVPARVAGVGEIIVCSPPTGGAISPIILAAAHVAGVDRVFGVGGAQAIAAMAYGTETIPHVDKVLGPGNIFVTLAKREVFGVVAIDQLAGPTETLLIADATASPASLAADLLAQAEHDPMASPILLTTDAGVARATREAWCEQLPSLARHAIASAAMANQGLIGVVPDLATAVDLSNRYAPEHLCLLVHDPWALVPLVRHAGGIFLGEDSPEALGDYAMGISHVMPTGGTARFSSPVHVADFTKVISLAAVNRQALDRLGPAAARLARAEGLTGHARAIERRLGTLPSDEAMPNA